MSEHRDRELLDLLADRLGLAGTNTSCDRDLVVAVERILIANPSLTANAVAAQVPARRQDVLRIVRELSPRPGPVPGPGNHVGESGS